MTNTLAMTNEVTHVVTTTALETYIRNFYKVSYDIKEFEKILTILPLMIVITKTNQLSPIALTNLREWALDGGVTKSHTLRHILQAQVNLGFLPAGNYKIVIA